MANWWKIVRDKRLSCLHSIKVSKTDVRTGKGLLMNLMGILGRPSSAEATVASISSVSDMTIAGDVCIHSQIQI